MQLLFSRLQASSPNAVLNLASEHALRNTLEAVMLNLTTLSNSTTGVVELSNVVEFYDFPKLAVIEPVIDTHFPLENINLVSSKFCSHNQFC